MARRTTPSDVQAVLQSDYDSSTSPDLDPYIRSANLMVDRVVTCATAKGITLTTDEKLWIETWLAAHLYACSDRPLDQKNTADSGGRFSGTTGMRLEATLYGQHAMALDYSGCLEALFQRRNRITARWLGRPPSEQTDYDDRD